MERYFVTNQNMIYKKNKYEIGKRYKVTQDMIKDYPFYDSFKNIQENVIYSLNFKIFIVKIYKTLSGKCYSFKILKEINYEIGNDKSIQAIEILAIKTRNKKILKDFLDSRMVVESQIAINCGMADYAISHGLYKNNQYILKALASLGRNSILNMISENIKLIREHNFSHILVKHGRPQDLNQLIKMFQNNLLLVSGISENGRRKDMMHGLSLINKNHYDNEDKNIFFASIIDTGIDWILDEIMNNQEIKKIQYILEKIIKKGRKKDINEIIKIKKMPLYLFQEIANVGFDEHLKMLKNHENSLISEYVSSYELPTI